MTGRPAGWCDLIARFWPVDAVVGENGAFWMWHDDKARKLRTRFVQSDAERAEGKRRLETACVPGAGRRAGRGHRLGPALSRADLAIDFCEDVPALPHDDVLRIVEDLRAARRPRQGELDPRQRLVRRLRQAHTSRRMMRELFGVDIEARRDRFVFSGDSPNDAPMASSPTRWAWPTCATSPPTWTICRAGSPRRGRCGFVELARR